MFPVNNVSVVWSRAWLSQQMEFSSRHLKLNDDADIMEELKGLTPDQLKTEVESLMRITSETED